jgi:tripartite-type tricarboxylate transporter receptor subunit TctC
MVHVPYKGGGPAGAAVASGETQLMIATIGALMPHLSGNRLRPLAVTSSDRVRQFPDVPTLDEAGVPGYEFTAWVGLFAPRGTPEPVVSKLNADVKLALSDAEVEKRLVNQVLDPMHLTPEEFGRRLKSDYDKYASLIKRVGARVD